MFDENDEELELRCPKCGCPKLVFKEIDEESETAFPPLLGKKATCFECSHSFVVTGNCWEAVDDR